MYLFTHSRMIDEHYIFVIWGVSRLSQIDKYMMGTVSLKSQNIYQ